METAQYFGRTVLFHERKEGTEEVVDRSGVN